jgi:hypothetical protein
MRHQPSGEGWATQVLSRRRWLAAVVAGCAVSSAGADRPAAALTPDDQRLQQEIEAHARKVGLTDFRSSHTKHYLGIGNAPDMFREKALQICESLEEDFLDHFQAKGFDVAEPKHRLPVVTLADAQSYEKFSGEPAPLGVGWFFDGETNRLVIFDNRAQGQGNREQAQRANLISLAHEATHQLTFNTGLLDLASDVPPCISEGLATYAEVRNPNGSTKIGKRNPGRFHGVAVGLGAGVPWMPLAQLLVDDKLFQGDGGDAALQLAYGQSWLLVFDLMKPADPAAFRNYLKAIKSRKDPAHRLDDARANLGDLNKLDLKLRRDAGL